MKWWQCRAHRGWSYAVYVRDDGKTDARFTCLRCGRRLGLLATLRRRFRGDPVYDEQGHRIGPEPCYRCGRPATHHAGGRMDQHCARP